MHRRLAPAVVLGTVIGLIGVPAAASAAPPAAAIVVRHVHLGGIGAYRPTPAGTGRLGPLSTEIPRSAGPDEGLAPAVSGPRADRTLAHPARSRGTPLPAASSAPDRSC
jgi:hypothetical protein